MKYCKILSATLLTLAVSTTIYAKDCCKHDDGKRDWNFIAYMQADNKLVPYSSYNIKEMQKVGSTMDVNILVQWDKPTSTQTNRYLIKRNKMVLKDTVQKAMGKKPASELKKLIKWAHKKFKAERYAFILWNHGNGVLDRSSEKIINPEWLSSDNNNQEEDTHDNDNEKRGILYDYAANTFLDNAGLSKVCKYVKKNLKNKIDILGMDANLMAMIEIAYQIQGTACFLVASQQTESGHGWPYKNVLQGIADDPKMCPADFATAIVQAYSEFYSSGVNADSGFTLSAIDIKKVKAAVIAFDSVLQALILSQSVNKTATNNAIKIARSKTLSFYHVDYIDLIDWYDNLTEGFTILIDSVKNKSCSDVCGPDRTSIIYAAKATLAAVAAAKSAAQDAIMATEAGLDYNGRAHGLSLYYPRSLKIDKSYKKTEFAKKTFWLKFLKTLK